MKNEDLKRKGFKTRETISPSPASSHWVISDFMTSTSPDESFLSYPQGKWDHKFEDITCPNVVPG